MQGRQDIQALATARRFDKQTRETPDQGQKGCIHEMRGIHKEDCPLTGLGFRQARLELLCFERFLDFRIGFGRNLSQLARLHA